ncbi:hypothetical protein BCLUESOX_1080 [bacterium endosymbiont of Bathymodiolus sp. 5 South]|nr:hypothetical protein [uncultured Gammaproteobacteria bacterium]SHN93844.1 hypothetical protein BCLUESOX_1080 [bacterium endosymbiont of Bathymodiolus sp. 5 South]VVH57307.1 hypothetical protein BSPCLSOX_769 [uncultured Gammaproteobacteria bacterium]VVM23407.1 hypothetical protein BSPWISOXPB_8798 [uncultured Gammaproteobacteria bacterium]VVM25106.1 hypothetical protein BSPWISOXPB_3139 [uncultured Gammaproteobacteria bacterium]
MRANMVEKATEYQYSSAAYHCRLVANNIITDYNIGVNVQEYEDYFMMGENQKALGVLRCNIYKGLSCGSDCFIADLGKMIGRDFGFKNVGRSKKGWLLLIFYFKNFQSYFYF